MDKDGYLGWGMFLDSVFIVNPTDKQKKKFKKKMMRKFRKKGIEVEEIEEVIEGDVLYGFVLKRDDEEIENEIITY